VKPLCIAPLLLALAAVAVAPAAGADSLPAVGGGEPASQVIDDLQSQGYNVQINWLNGFDAKPLSQCVVSGINDPNSSAPSPQTFTTVYVDVSCPNGGDPAFTGGIG
jgi:hypothetical protein